MQMSLHWEWRLPLKSEDGLMPRSNFKKNSFSCPTFIRSGNHISSIFKINAEKLDHSSSLPVWTLAPATIISHLDYPCLWQNILKPVAKVSTSLLYWKLHWMPFSLRVKATVPQWATRPIKSSQHPDPLHLLSPSHCSLLSSYASLHCSWACPCLQDLALILPLPGIVFIQISIWKRSSFCSRFLWILLCPRGLLQSPYLILQPAHLWPIPLTLLYFFFHRSQHLQS